MYVQKDRAKDRKQEGDGKPKQEDISVDEARNEVEYAFQAATTEDDANQIRARLEGKFAGIRNAFNHGTVMALIDRLHGEALARIRSGSGKPQG